MGDIAQVTGMVISSMPVGEYDRRIVLLTKERGKISAFAKGARKMNSPLMGVTRAFVFGTFELYEGRTSYNIRQADIKKYFEEIITDLDAVCYACYFAEVADYYGREGLDASMIVNLLYISLNALAARKIPKQLIRYIYELKMIQMNGECPEFFSCHNCGSEQDLDTYSVINNGLYCKECKIQVKDGIHISESTVYTLQYIISSPLEKLYSFTVNEEVLTEMRMVMGRLCSQTFDKHMKSLEMLPE
jgi:DNA repair protein RecO (recombination protein O)